MVAASHTWLCKFKCIELNKSENAVPQVHRAHFKCSMAPVAVCYAVGPHRHRPFLPSVEILLDRADADTHQPCLHPFRLL